MKASVNVRITTTTAQRTIVRKALAAFEDTGLLPHGLTAQIIDDLASPILARHTESPAKMLTRKQIAELLCLSYRSVQSLEAQGVIKPVRLSGRAGGAVRFRAEDVVRLQAGNIRHG